MINRCQCGLFGGISRMDHVEKVLSGEKKIYVRATTSAIDAVNAGFVMGLSYPFEKAVKDMSAIAEFCSILKSDPSGDSLGS